VRTKKARIGARFRAAIEIGRDAQGAVIGGSAVIIRNPSVQWGKSGIAPATVSTVSSAQRMLPASALGLEPTPPSPV
jgi:hypothetical protein